jgi:cytochrome oxidase Cu insertion factor (SCO1/SenC/PrrC family)
MENPPAEHACSACSPGGFPEDDMKKFYSHALLAIMALIWLSLTVSAQIKLGPKDGADLPPADLSRIKVGDAAPDFTLEDQDAQPVTLSGFRHQKPVVLVFYRGYW